MKFIYENVFGKTIELSGESPYRLITIQGLSENTINVYEASSVNQIGATLMSTKVQPKNIIFTGDFDYSNDLHMNMINTIIPGKKAKLRYISEGLDVYLEVTPTSTPTLSPNIVIQDFQFEVRSSFPYWQETISTVFNFAQMIPMFMLPCSFSSTVQWMISKSSKTYILRVKNDSTQETGFTLTLEASTKVTGPELLNIETQEHIKLRDDFVLNAGEKLVITTYENNKQCILIKNGLEFPAFRYLTDDTSFFNLMPGDNLIRYGADDNYNGLIAKIEFSRTLAGV